MEELEQFDRENLMKIAQWYYFDGLTQEKIAEKMNCTRQRMNRIVRSLIDLGVVSIKLNGTIGRYATLENRLEKAFALKRVIIADVDHAADSKLVLSRKTAQFLESFINNRQKVGISFGSTLSQVVACMKTQVKSLCTVVQLSGGVDVEHMLSTIRPDATARQLARKLSCDPMLLCCSQKMRDKGPKEYLDDQLVQKTMTAYGSCDIAIVGIGEISQEGSAFKLDYIDREQLKKAQSRGCIGEIAFNTYTGEGAWNGYLPGEKAIGIDAGRLEEIPYVIAVAEGEKKTDCVLGALRTGAVDILAIDSLLAKRLAKRLQLDSARE